MRKQSALLHRTLALSGPILLVPLVALGIAALSKESFEWLAQEDGPVEWLTFWAFAAAGLLTLTSPRLHGTRAGAGVTGPLTRPFLLAFALGALLIALEEISWGQRLLGYRPPEWFLRDNFQQELNLHNLADADTRGHLLVGLLFTFGVLYPLLSRIPPSSRWLDALGVPALPPTLLPGFVALIAFYVAYPLRYTGEWVELGAGIGFLMAALTYRFGFGDRRVWVCLAAMVAAGLLTPLGQAALADPARAELAAVESAALAEDFARKRYRSRCGVHKRLYTFVAEYGGSEFAATAFGTLAGSESDLERRRFFLDPWNLPYWIRHTCSRDRQSSTVYVYSFGPNRRRDSRADSLESDDVGAWVSRPPSR